MEVTKRLRQQAIRELIERRPIGTQRELAAALREQGLQATQATVSRDIAELDLVKLARDGVSAYALPSRPDEPDVGGEERLARLLHAQPVEIRPAGLLLVVRTVPGSAHAVAAAVDRARWPEVVGSIAGDDTLFIAFADRVSQERIRKRLVRLAGRMPAGRPPTGRAPTT